MNKWFTVWHRLVKMEVSEVLPRKVAMLDFCEIQTSSFKENANVILL